MGRSGGCLAEQEKFRDWLKGQPPEEVLNHAYEYTIREDILMSLEYHNLSDAQADALMKFPSPLADVFRDFEKRETDHMDVIWDCLESRADMLLEEQRRALRETPVYPFPRAMLRNMASWSSTGHPTEPTPPARKLSKRQSGSITMETRWTVRQRNL